jgi:hypothetical protein
MPVGTLASLITRTGHKVNGVVKFIGRDQYGPVRIFEITVKPSGPYTKGQRFVIGMLDRALTVR